MSRTIKDFKIPYTIVLFIVVFVVYYLITIKNSTKMIFH